MFISKHTASHFQDHLRAVLEAREYQRGMQCGNFRDLAEVRVQSVRVARLYLDAIQQPNAYWRLNTRWEPNRKLWCYSISEWFVKITRPTSKSINIFGGDLRHYAWNKDLYIKWLIWKKRSWRNFNNNVTQFTNFKFNDVFMMRNEVFYK